MLNNTNKKQLFVGLLFIFTEHLKLNKMKKQKYEVGDIVEIKSEKHGHGFKIGDKVTIISRDPESNNDLGDYLTKKDVNDTKFGWWIMDDEIV